MPANRRCAPSSMPHCSMPCALLALWIAARFVAGQVGDPQGVHGKIAHQILLGLLYWRGFNFVFRIWLRPNTPEGRIAPVDDATAARLLVGMNVVIVLPLLARQIVMFMQTTGAAPHDRGGRHPADRAGDRRGGLIYAVWHWRHDDGGLARRHGPADARPSTRSSSAWPTAGGSAALPSTCWSVLAAMLAAVTERSAAMQRHRRRRIDADPAAAAGDADPSADPPPADRGADGRRRGRGLPAAGAAAGGHRGRGRRHPDRRARHDGRRPNGRRTRARSGSPPSRRSPSTCCGAS